MTVLNVQSISKTFPAKQKQGVVHANRDIHLQIEEGQIYGLLGPNGAGKSTLINIISGILLPDQGSVTIYDKDVIHDTEAAKRLMGVVPQEIVVEMAFNVEEVLYYYAGMYGVPQQERNTLIEAALTDLDLLDKRLAKARTLSGGMKRRLMIAKAILHKPKFLILDEPTAGVDVALRQKIWALVRRMNEQGTTILFTTHYLEEAEQLCEAITLIDQGKVIKQGSLKDIQKEFAENVVAFELYDNKVEHLPNVHENATQFHFPITDLAEDMQKVIQHYGDNLKSVKSEAASLEQIFLQLTHHGN
ncbi:ATP-binding cassette domain-containing protein [Candidatus Uhrbacteria bacterium]|nr:ATP-binding cassette domain-containing protein [Candidatus Uhrbacteria bacterium]MBD3283834.1 ATP-binding cassette domain-containing protein [Candidatus Uhrbacteria bacterium]